MQGFVKISKYAGMREDLVQAGGGNSSFKLSEERMAIKASGYQLADITENEGYALVNPKIIKDAFLNAHNLEELTEKDSEKILSDAFIEGKRASIETFLHSVSKKYTLHTHSIAVNVLACRVDGMEVLKDLFPEALIVPYAKPGVELAKEYFKAFKAKEGDFNIAFLANHGLVVTADTADEVIDITESVNEKICSYLSMDASANKTVTDIWKYFPEKIVWKVTDCNVMDAYKKIGMFKHQFCPDCIVFLGKKAIDFSQLGQLQDFIETNANPVLVTKNENLYIVAASVKKALETQSVLSFAAQVMVANKGHECNMLTENQMNELLNWDAEKYRQQMK